MFMLYTHCSLIKWCWRQDLNLQPDAYEATALPIEATPALEDPLGFEPRTDGLKVHCTTYCAMGPEWLPDLGSNQGQND